MNRFILYTIIFLGFLSCNDLTLQEADPDVAVVECYIQPGDSISVRVTRQLIFGSSDTIEQTIDSLNVYISIGSDMELLQKQSNGYYFSDALTIEPGNEILLEFDYNEVLVSASTTMPDKPEEFEVSSYTVEAWQRPGDFEPGSTPDMPDPVTFSWSNPDEEYHLIVVENTEDDPTPINDDEDEDRPHPNFRSTPTQGSSQELQPMMFEYYGHHRVILFKLNAEYAALYEQIGNSSLDISAPPSNIENGLGIFTGINSDTLFVNVVDK